MHRTKGRVKVLKHLQFEHKAIHLYGRWKK